MGDFRVRRTRQLIVALALAAMPAPAALAQIHMTSARLVGTVADPSGAPVPGATVTATATDTNIVRTTVSDSTGAYSLIALDPGTYRLVASLSGFADAVGENIQLALGDTVTLPLRLQLADVQQSVRVTASAPLLDLRRTEVSAVVSERQIQSLPINRRNFIGLATINAGVSADNTPLQGVSLTSGLSFNGQPGRTNNVIVDGFDNNMRSTGGVRGLFGQDAIREYRVMSASYTAEFGKAAGGVVNIITRSGTNSYRGGGLFLFRDDALNAKEYFEKFTPAGVPIDREKAPFSQKQWAGFLGGPLVKDRSFLFLSFERADLTPNNFVSIDPVTAGVLTANGFPVTLGNVPYIDDTWQAMGKVDHAWTPQHRLVVRGNASDGRNENVERYGGIVARSNGVVQLPASWTVAGSEVDLISTSWLNELRAQVNVTDVDNLSLDPLCTRGCDDDHDGGPTVEVSGAAVAGRSRITPTRQWERRVQFLDTVSYFRGAHAFKAGVDVSMIAGESSLALNFGGRYIFSPLPALPALGLPAPVSATQALALGLPAAYVQGYGDPTIELPSTDAAFFVQDEWRVRPTLTLNLGLRYQRQYWPDWPMQTNGLNGTFTIPSDGDNIAPRLAMAFTPAGSSGTAVRAAYGIFHDRTLSSIPGIASLVDGRNGVRTLVLQLPQSVAAWRAPDHRLPAPASFPSLQFALDPNLRTPLSHQTTFGIEHQFPPRLTAAVDVMYIRGLEHVGSIDYNPIVPSLGAGRRPLDVGGQAGTSASVLQYTSFGETWYRGLSVSVRRPLAGRYEFASSYTWAKAEDTLTDFQSAFVPENNGTGRRSPSDVGLPIGFDPQDERGPSSNDRRHRVVATGLVLLPLELQLSGLVTASSGRPYSILAGVDLNGDGNGGGFPTDRARENPADPATGLSRNSGRLPAAASVDLRVSRRFAVQRSSVELIAEVYNLFNRTTFIDINNIFGPGSYPQAPLSTYGQYTAAAPPRQVQLGIRAEW